MKKSKKILLILFLVFVLGGCGCPLLASTSHAETRYKLKNAEELDENNWYNPQYLEYLEADEETKKMYTAIPEKYYVPMEEVDTEEEEYISYSIASPILRVNTLLSEAGLELEPGKSFSLKETLNDRNIKINVEDQGNYGLCWTFASLGSLRTHLALKGIYDEENNSTLDFSEWHLNYLTSSKYADKYGSQRDPLGISGEIGGKMTNALNYFKWNDGPVLESEDLPQYGTKVNDSELDALDDERPYVYVHDVKFYPTFVKEKNSNGDIEIYNGSNKLEDEEELERYRQYRKEMKQQIMENGGLYAYIRFSSSNFSAYFLGEADQYENVDEKYAHYDDGTSSDSDIYGHAVLIVGWDDDFPKEKFHSKNKNGDYVQPKNNGAYLILNSHGEEHYNNGYLWVSYDDANIESSVSGITSADFNEQKLESKFSNEKSYNKFAQFLETQGGEIEKDDSTKTVKALDIIFNTMEELTLENAYLTSEDIKEITKNTPKMSELHLQGNKIDNLQFWDDNLKLVALDLRNQSIEYTTESDSDTFSYPGNKSLISYVLSNKPDNAFHSDLTFTGCLELPNKTGVKLTSNKAATITVNSGIAAGTVFTIKRSGNTEPTITNVILEEPSKKTYFIGEDLDLTGGKLIIYYSDGNNEEINLDDLDAENIEGFDSSSAGSSTVTVKYGDEIEKSFTVTIKEKNLEVKNIAITKIPNKIYYVGDTIDLDDIEVKAIMSDDSVVTIKKGEYSINKTKFDTAGQHEIEITYQGKKASFTITVNELTIKEITFVEPIKKQYFIDEPQDLTGGKFIVKYNNDSTKTINLDDDSVEKEGFDNSTLGEKTITVKYENETKEYEIIVVTKKVVDIEIVSLPNRTTFCVGEKFDPTGMKVKHIYEDGTSSEEILAFRNDVNDEEFAQIGEKTIFVAFYDVMKPFNVNILELKGISIDKEPKKEYFVGEDLDVSDGKVKVIYSDDTEEIVDMDDERFEIEGFDNQESGEQTITVKYLEETVDFSVEVISVELESIRVKQEPDKMEYEQGEELDLKGLVIEGTNNNNTKFDIKSGYKADIQTMNTVGRQKITITYGGKTTYFYVQVAEKEEPKEDDPKEDAPKQDDPKEDEPKEDDPKQDDPKEDEPKEDEPKQDDPKEDEPKEEEPKQDDPKEDEPKEDEPKEEDPKQDDPKEDEPKEDDPKEDNPKQDEQKQDEPKQAEQKQETKQSTQQQSNNTQSTSNEQRAKQTTITTTTSSKTSNTTNQKTTTTSDKEIPKTGNVGIGVLIIILIISAVIFYKKYKNIK